MKKLLNISDLNQKDFNKALNYLKTAEKIGPKNHDVFLNLGINFNPLKWTLDYSLKTLD